MRFFCVLLVLFSLANETATVSAEEVAVNSAKNQPANLPTIEGFEKRKQRFVGFQPFLFDEAAGDVWLEIENWEKEFLFVHSLSTGLGSNPVGLDRGKLGKEYVCCFRRVGKKVMLVAKNLAYRASSENLAERRAVRESFAESILWGGTIAAQTGDKVLVKATDLLLTDLQGIADTLRRRDQGTFTVDRSRSAVYLARCKAFPKNTELESTVTFSGSKPGDDVREVTPMPKAITLRLHFSFIELPDDNYRPRLHDPRAPSIFIRFSDYSAPIDRPLEQRWITRHRLQKKDPDAAVSEPVKPIVYFVDAGAPPQVRDALIEGASWWNEAFEAAGFKDAFQVRVMPADADPLDVRYNVIQWVHRSTRGWSYGNSIVDPRTGEIMKGHVTLGSLRVRQDRLLFDGMPSTKQLLANQCACCGIIGISEEPTLAALAGPPTLSNQRAVETALARIRQLSAHEVGHTLGFVHNFAASTYDDRASVMDYPAPRVKITTSNELDLTNAYGVGVGTWDQFAVKYAYSQFPTDADEAGELKRIVQQSIDRRMIFVSDADARPAAAAHPLGNLWDNGTDPVEQLKHVMRVRQIALEKLSPESLLDGQTIADLEQLFVPIYLHHRYQLDAVAKMIGGVEYCYAIKGDGQIPLQDVAGADQRRALEALLATIKPNNLKIPKSVLQQLPPKPYGSLRDIERFGSGSSPIFDPLSAARVAVDMTVANVLQPQRIARLVSQTHENGFDALEVVNKLVATGWTTNGDLGIRQVVQQSILDHLIKLADSPTASIAAKSVALSGISEIRDLLGRSGGSMKELAGSQVLLQQIKRFSARPHPSVPPNKQQVRPPGSPIGND